MTTFVKMLCTSLLSLGMVAGLSQTSAVTTQPTRTTSQKVETTLEQAKQIALKKVNGKITKAHLDDDHYDIEIIKDGYEYDLEIDLTGKIVDLDKEKVEKDTTQSTQSTRITLEKAKQIALKKVNGKITKAHLDDDHYDIEIVKDGYEYDLEIDYNGKIVDLDKERIEKKTTKPKQITLEKAKQIALNKINGKIVSVEKDSDDYEIEIRKDNVLYEIEINVYTGKIEDIEKESLKATSMISKEKAKQIALTRVNGRVVDIEFDHDDHEYSVEIVKDNIEYEVTIDATSSRVLEVEKDD